jgi:hypothetical protein
MLLLLSNNKKMKNLLLITSILFFGSIILPSHAQITVTDSDMPQENYSYISDVVADFIGVDYMQTGINQTWDYSSLIGIALDTLYCAPVSSTPFAYQFFFNNIFLYPDYVANYAVPAPDLGAGGGAGVALTDRFEYFRNDSQGHQIVGFGAEIQAIPTSVKYDTIDYIYDFPMDFGNSTTSNAEYLIAVPTFGAYGQWITRSKVVDGWGSVSTPAGTYNCLRVQTVLEQTDTIFADIVGFGSVIPRPNDTIYDFITTGEGIPVLTITVGVAGISQVLFKSSELTSIKETPTQRIELYPNPATNRIVLETDRNGSLEIFDLSGKLINKRNYSAFNEIDLSNMSQGLYHIVLTSNQGEKVSRKIEVIK